MVRPMYHTHPGVCEATERKNEYWFGTSLIAAPITRRRDPATGLAEAEVWLPEGDYIDFFTGRVYSGNTLWKAYRTLENFPLFVKAGAILPLADDGVKNGTDNPEKIELRVYGGADGEFTLIEDDGGAEPVVCRTGYRFTYGTDSLLTVRAPAAAGVVPKVREYTVKFVAFSAPERVMLNGEALDFCFDAETNTVTAAPFPVKENTAVTVQITTNGQLPENAVQAAAQKLLFDTNGLPAMQLEALCRIVGKPTPAASRILEICAVTDNEYLKGALVEILSSY